MQVYTMTNKFNLYHSNTYVCYCASIFILLIMKLYNSKLSSYMQMPKNRKATNIVNILCIWMCDYFYIFYLIPRLIACFLFFHKIKFTYTHFNIAVRYWHLWCLFICDFIYNSFYSQKELLTFSCRKCR